MRGLWLLSWRHVLHHRVQTGILTVCIALSVFLPVTTHVLIDRYERDLGARASSTPLLLGAKGSRFDLALAALYYLQKDIETVPFGQVKWVQETGHGLAIPINVRHTAQRHPIVGTSSEYYDARGLVPGRGTLPLVLGDVLLGADVASKLKLDVGDALSSDPSDEFDLRSLSLRMKVCGVLPFTNTPDDGACLVDIQTCWILEGAAHGHTDAEKLDNKQVLAKKDNMVAVSPAVKEFQEITETNIDSFHVHGDEGKLPLSAVMVVPNSDKSGTILKAEVNNRSAYQMVVPTEVIDDLMAFVFKIKKLLDTFSVVLAVSTGLMLVLQLLLSMRLRAGEMATLNRMGCSPGTVGRLYGTEILLVLVFGTALAVLGVGVVGYVLPDLVQMF